MEKGKDLINAVIERTRESEGKKRLACAEAFKLAEEFEVTIVEIGRICDQQNVKIRKCQLGCFK